MTDASTFPEELVRLRERARLSQRALGEKMAEVLGEPLTGQAISEWERGKNLPNRRNAAALENALGVAPGTLTELLGEGAERSIHDRLDGIEAKVDQLARLIEERLSRQT